MSRIVKSYSEMADLCPSLKQSPGPEPEAAKKLVKKQVEDIDRWAQQNKLEFAFTITLYGHEPHFVFSHFIAYKTL
jgi:hypothetical protein